MVTGNEGTYNVDIHAFNYGINTDFATTFDVRQSYEFDIIRTAQSKIDPITNPNKFDVKLDVTSFVNASSIIIQEKVPSVFDVQTDAIVSIVNNTKILTWTKDLVDSKTQIEYSYSVPLDFPQLYPLGPVEITYGSSKFAEGSTMVCGK